MSRATIELSRNPRRSDVGDIARRVTLVIILALAIFKGYAGAANAQDDILPSATPEQRFTAVEEAIDEEHVQRDHLLDLRAELTRSRQALARTVRAGSLEARGLAAQMEALGPTPSSAETEPVAIARRRAELEEAYAAAHAPILRADEFLHRTEFLIIEIDERLRAEDAREILVRSPSPVSPSHWNAAARDIERYAKTVLSQFDVERRSAGGRAALDRARSQAILLVAAGVAAALLRRPIMRRVLLATTQGRTRAQRWSFVILAHVLRLVVPMAVLFLLVGSVWREGIVPPAMQSLPVGLLLAGLVFVVAHWLGHALFSPEEPKYRMLALDTRSAWRGTRLCHGLGAVLSIAVFLEVVAQDYPFSAATISVLSFPVVAGISIGLWFLGGLLRAAWGGEGADEHRPAEQIDAGFLWFLTVLMRVTAVVAPVLVVFGYVNLANHAIVPMVVTITCLGVALLLYHATIAVMRVLFVQQDGGLPPLLPVLIITILAFVCLPLLALAWGARMAGIAEFWRILSEGVSLGDVRLTFDSILVLFLVLIAGLALTRWLQRLVRISVMPRTHLDRGARSAIVTGIGYAGLTLTALVAVSAAGLDLSSLAVVVGALSLGIGFGLQTIVSNFVAGLILLVERPIKEGDWIEVSGFSGIVRKISVRSTRIETFDRHDVMVPNQALIADTVKNMTLSTQTGRLIIPVEIAYDSDLAEARHILRAKAEMDGRVLSYPEPQILFLGPGENALGFELRCFLRDIGEILTVRSDLLLEIYGAFSKAGIRFPYPQRDVHLYGAGAFTQPAPRASKD